VGIGEGGNYSFAAAIGLFEALIGVALVITANQISKRAVGASLW
jgi:putative aldouronate transport system permease protein